MPFSIKIRGLRELQEKMKQYPQMSATLVNEAVKKSILDIERSTKPITPIDNGDLKRGFRTEFSPLKGKLYNPVEYAIYVHEGTRFQKAQPFMQRGMEASEAIVNNNFSSALRMIVNKL